MTEPDLTSSHVEHADGDPRNNHPVNLAIIDDARTLTAEQVRVGNLIQAVHGDPRWEPVLLIEHDHQAGPWGTDLGITTERRDGSEHLRFWASADPIRIMR